MSLCRIEWFWYNNISYIFTCACYKRFSCFRCRLRIIDDFQHLLIIKRSTRIFSKGIFEFSKGINLLLCKKRLSEVFWYWFSRMYELEMDGHCMRWLKEKNYLDFGTKLSFVYFFSQGGDETVFSILLSIIRNHFALSSNVSGNLA